jgi:hypothetical protein
MTVARTAAAMLGCGLLFSAASAGPARVTGRTPVATTPRFALYSDFDTNLNDALIAVGVARTFRKPELFRSGDEAACFDKLPLSARAAWEGAADYYAKVISPAEWNGRPQYLVRVQLAGFDDEWSDADARQFVEIARSFRVSASPAYEACRWTARDEKNRRWIEDLKSRLASDGKKIAARVEQLYQKRWKGLPIPVDVVETVNWAGANSILRGPAGGHLLISTEYQGPAALEVVFHEASHILMDAGDPVRKALDKAARAAGFPLPDDLWHVVLFYTTGEAVRRTLDEGGKQGYIPMLYAMFDRGTWGNYRTALERSWRPYLDGQRTLREASTGLIETLKSPVKPQSSEDAPK